MNDWRFWPILVFLVSAGLVSYAWLIYPALLWAAARRFGRSRQAGPLAGPDLPPVTLLIAAHDEQDVIAARVENALATEYPADRFEILIASDGSGDRTNEIVKGFAGRGVRLLDYRARRGKAAVLNDAMREARGWVVVFSDANTFADAGAVRSLVRWFADPRVGAVCGRLVITDPVSGKNADGLYWKYETFLKIREAKLGALLGSNGAIYAVRCDVFQPIPAGTIIDDFVIPLLARLVTGCELLYDRDAVAREDSAPDAAAEFGRRARIGAGGWQALGLLWPLLNPARGWLAFAFFSHKVLRWLCPFFLLAALAANLSLTGSAVWRALLLCQALFYGGALAGAFAPAGGKAVKALRLLNMFVGMNAALLIGFFRWAAGPQTGIWSRTERNPGESAPGAAVISLPENLL